MKYKNYLYTKLKTFDSITVKNLSILWQFEITLGKNEALETKMKRSLSV